MKVTVVYDGLTAEEIACLLMQDKVVSVKKEIDGVEADIALEWIRARDLNGYAITGAYELYCNDVSEKLARNKFVNMVKSEGYITKNVRISTAVHRCFVRKDGF